MPANVWVDVVNTIWDIFRYGWPFFILSIIVIWKLRWKSWPLDVIIIEKRGSNLVRTNDRCGKYYEKSTGLTGYKFLKSKDKIPVPNFEWILHTNPQPTNLLERFVKMLRPTAGTIVFFKYGTKQYKPIEIKMNGKLKKKYQELLDIEGKPIIMNIYEQIDPRDKLKMLDFVVVDWDNINFMVQEQRASQERRRKSSELWKQIIIPLAMLGMTLVFCIIMIKLASDQAVAIRSSAGQNTQASKAEPPNIPIISDILPAS